MIDNVPLFRCRLSITFFQELELGLLLQRFVRNPYFIFSLLFGLLLPHSLYLPVWEQ